MSSLVRSIVLQPAQLHCINSDCRQPHQTAGNKYCQACGTPLLLRDRYLVRQKLGSGGFAMTFGVWDFQLQRDRVLKVLTETAPKAIELFEQEAQVLAKLRHPGIPQVEPDSYFQVASPQRWLPCLVMEKINGQTLQELTDRYPQGCPPEWIVDWLRQAIDILQLLHQQQIIHRDIKPSNLMLRQGSGQLVMIDFGGVKQLHSFAPNSLAPTSSTRLFSPGYSPPEQSAGMSVNGTADFFALGRTLIQLLTGQPPAAIEDPRTGTLNWHSYAQVSPRLASLLDDMTHPDPRRRPQSAEAIRSRLLPILDSYTRTGVTAAIAIKRRRSIKLPNLGSSLMWMLRSIWWTISAVFATLWSSVLAAIGAIVGTTIAYGIAFYTSWGTNLIAWLSQQISESPQFEVAIGLDLLIFAFAGWGTAWGLTAAGGLGQRRRIWSGVIGALAYAIGWFSLHRVQLEGATVGLTTFAAIAPALLVLGLGMTRYPLIRAIAAIVSITPCIAILAEANSTTTASLWEMLTTASLENWTFWPCLVFFALLAVLLAACLSITHYFFIPLVDWLIHPAVQRSPAHRSRIRPGSASRSRPATHR